MAQPLSSVKMKKENVRPYRTIYYIHLSVDKGGTWMLQPRLAKTPVTLFSTPGASFTNIASVWEMKPLGCQLQIPNRHPSIHIEFSTRNELDKGIVILIFTLKMINLEFEPWLHEWSMRQLEQTQCNVQNWFHALVRKVDLHHPLRPAHPPNEHPKLGGTRHHHYLTPPRKRHPTTASVMPK